MTPDDVSALLMALLGIVPLFGAVMLVTIVERHLS